MIHLEQLERVFEVGDQNVYALDGVDLDINAGEYVSIMGPSGSGKSTLLNMMGLLDRPTAGCYLLDDRDVTRLDDTEQARMRRHKIGFVFQFFHLIPRMTAAENIELPLILDGMPAMNRRQHVRRVLETFGLDNRADHRPDQLSGGQRQRVAIARATILEPEVLLADEPTGNLDQASGHEIIEVLERLNANRITLVIVTHDPELGGRSHRAIRMIDGRIVDDARQAGIPKSSP